MKLGTLSNNAPITYIWQVDVLEKSMEKLEDIDYLKQHFDCESEVYKVPEACLKLENKNILAFHEIEFGDSKRLVVFYDDYTLETYEENEYTCNFQYKLPIQKLFSFCYDKEALYLCEKIDDNYQLLRFDYDGKFK